MYHHSLSFYVFHFIKFPLALYRFAHIARTRFLLDTVSPWVILSRTCLPLPPPMGLTTLVMLATPAQLVAVIVKVVIFQPVPQHAYFHISL